jgi:hypothetical protein
MHPSLLKAFQRHQEHDMGHPGLVDLITNYKTQQTTFLHSLVDLKTNYKTQETTFLHSLVDLKTNYKTQQTTILHRYIDHMRKATSVFWNAFPEMSTK